MWTILMLAVMVVLVENSIAEPYPRHHHHHHHRHPYLAVGTLAFAGGYIAGRRHHNGGGCYNCGCGGCGGSCGWCGGSYYGRRRRRDIEDFVSDPQIIETYAKIASQDKDQCGLRLVCELAQKDPRNLAEDEIQILLPYRGAGESDDTIYGDYDEAAWHGQEGHPCPTNYPLCAFTAQQVMTEYRKYATTSNNAPHQT